MDKIRVAIVDDNDKMVEMMDEYLGSDDEINVIGRAKNGEEAFDLIKGTSPDVVLLDLIMPKMDGLSLMDKIHKDGTMIRMPFFYNNFCNKQWSGYSGFI
mgnify:CR=1 FL=1